jgi:hypothetical protein
MPTDQEENSMDANGQYAAMIIPSDDTRAETMFQAEMDARVETFVAVDPEYRKYYESDMEQIAALESRALDAIAGIKQKVLPQFQADDVQALGDKALQELIPYEANRVFRLVAEVSRLQAKIPKPPELSEIAQNTKRMTVLYVLGQLTGQPLSISVGTTVPADLNDPVHLRILFEQMLEQGSPETVSAILDDPMQRHRRALTDEQRERAKAMLGLAASPELTRQLTAYGELIARYRSRMARMRQRLQAQGWQSPDPIALQARGTPPPAA